MENKSILILITFLSLICILSISNVSAADFNGGSLTELNESIQNNYDGVISINNDININSEDASYFKTSGININKSITIDGNNHVINANNGCVQLFDINEKGVNVVIKNIVINGLQISSETPSIVIDSHASVLLDNVTFINSKTDYLIYNEGNLLVNNSNFISCDSNFGIYNINPLSSLIISNSIFQDNFNTLFYVEEGTFTMSNTYFLRNENIFFGFMIVQSAVISNCLFELNKFENNIQSGMAFLSVNNCIFANNNITSKKGIFTDGYETRLNYNLFIGNQISHCLINNLVNGGFYFNGNYFGTNTPIEDGIVITTQTINPSNTVFVEISSDENVNFSDLKIGKPINLTIRYVGNGCENLEPINTNIYFNSNLAIVNKNSIFLSANPTNITLTPTKSGNYSLLLDSGYFTPLASFNFTNEYIVLKNYTLTLNHEDSFKYNDYVNIKVNLIDELGNNITGTVNVVIGNKSFKVNVINGIGYLNITGFDVGQYLINATYITTDYFYDNANCVSYFMISKIIPNIEILMENTVAGQNKVITVRLPSDAKGDIQILINGLSGQGGFVELVNGEVTYTFADLTTGTKALWIYYTGDNNYYSIEHSTTFYVSPYIPDEPDTPDTPVIPDIPIPDTPDTPVIPDVPDIPVSPEIPINPDVPYVPENPTTSENPEENTNPNNNNQTGTDNGDNGNNEAFRSSDDINSNDNMESQNVQVGSTVNNAISRATSQSDSVGGDSSQAYELNNQSVSRNIGSSNNLIPGLILAIIIIILLIIGYKSRRDKDS